MLCKKSKCSKACAVYPAKQQLLLCCKAANYQQLAQLQHHIGQATTKPHHHHHSLNHCTTSFNSRPRPCAILEVICLRLDVQVSAILQRQLPVVLSQWGAPLGSPSHPPPLCSVPVGLAKSLGKPHVTFFVTNQQPWAHFNGTRASVLQFVSLHTHTTAAKSERSRKKPPHTTTTSASC